MHLGIIKITFNRTAQPRCYHGWQFRELGKEVILTLLWQSGASESATVCFVLSLSICYWLLKCACVCVCVRVCERGRHGHTTAACLQTHTSFITVSVTWLCSPLGLELMVKLRTLLTVITFILKAKARDYGKGCYISDAACDVRPITMHCASWPIRADWAWRPLLRALCFCMYKHVSIQHRNPNYAVRLLCYFLEVLK